MVHSLVPVNWSLSFASILSYLISFRAITCRQCHSATPRFCFHLAIDKDIRRHQPSAEPCGCCQTNPALVEFLAARIFFTRVPRQHTNYLEGVIICCCWHRSGSTGLASGVATKTNKQPMLVYVRETKRVSCADASIR